MKKLIWVGASLLGLWSLSANALDNRDPLANLPSLGDGVAGELSTNDERRLGELIMRDYRAYGAVTEDAEITAYIGRLGRRIAMAAGENPDRFEFFLVADKSINAFALPGGFIGIHTGLLTNAQTEAELASVVAHEVGHVSQRHISRMFGQQKQTSMVSAAAMIAALLVASTNPQAAQGLAMAGAGYGIDKQLGFSRDAEREADRVGFLTLAKAGYDVQGMVDFFGRLQQSSRLYENNAPAYLRTHPLTTERISDIRNRAGFDAKGNATRAAFAAAPAEDSPLEFELIRVKSLVYGDKTVQQLNDRLKLLSQPLQQLAIADPVALAYGRSLVLDQLNRRSEAMLELRRGFDLLAKRKVNADNLPLLMVNQRLLLQIALRSPSLGKQDFPPPRELNALNADERQLYADLEQHRNQFKNEMSARLVYIKGLQALGLNTMVESYMRDLLIAFRGNHQLLELLAQNDLALGKRAYHHYHLAQSYAARRAFFPALEQTNLAKQFARDDYYLLAEIDARQREYKQRVDEERLAEKRFQ